MLITRNGVVNRQRVNEIRVIGRATQGVGCHLDEGDVLVDVARVVLEDDQGSRSREWPRSHAGRRWRSSKRIGRADRRCRRLRVDRMTCTRSRRARTARMSALVQRDAH